MEAEGKLRNLQRISPTQHDILVCQSTLDIYFSFLTVIFFPRVYPQLLIYCKDVIKNGSRGLLIMFTCKGEQMCVGLRPFNIPTLIPCLLL